MHINVRAYRFTLVLVAALVLAPAYAQFFTDISPIDPDRQSFERAVANQLMEGFPDGTFRPDTPVRLAESVMVRARFYHILLRGFMVLPAPTVATPTVAGIPTKHWVYPAARFLAERGMLVAADGNLTATATGALTRGALLADISRMLHAGVPQTPTTVASEFTEQCLLPTGWQDDLTRPVTRRDMACLLDTLLNYLTQNAITEGTVTAFELDDRGNRWVHLDTALGDARLCLPPRGIIMQGGTAEMLREGTRIRTVSDAISGVSGTPYYRVREVTIIPATAHR